MNYTYGMLHTAPLFTSFDRQVLGGVCLDPTRPWKGNTPPQALPISERLSEQLVSFPRLDTNSERFVRGCGRAIKKVLAAFQGSRAEVADPTPQLANA